MLKITSDKELLEWINKQYPITKAYWSDCYKKMQDDLDFLFDEHMQWSDKVSLERTMFSQKGNLTVNETYIAYKNIMNRILANKASITVDADNDEASVETGKYLRGRLRKIEQKSKAFASYEWAEGLAIGGGLGFARISIDYVSPYSFDKELKVDRVINPFCVFPEAGNRHDFADSEYFFIESVISLDEYNQLKNKSTDKEYLENGKQQTNVTDAINQDLNQDECRILEVFYKNYKDKTLVELSNGDEVILEDSNINITTTNNFDGSQSSETVPLKDYLKDNNDLKIVRELKVSIPTVKYCKTDGSKIYEKSDWVGNYIPIAPFVGREYFYKGKRNFFGMVRNARSPQELLNWAISEAVYEMGLHSAPKWVIAEGSLTQQQEMNLNNRQVRTIKYIPKFTASGQMLPPPSYQQFEPATQSLTQLSQLSSEFIKISTGVFQASTGEKSNETSGLAIAKRSAQTEINNFDYTNNYEIALEYVGTILVDAIKELEAKATGSKPIIDESGTQTLQKVNEPIMKNGKQIIINPSEGDYSVTVRLGESYASKKQEQAGLILELLNISPTLAEKNPMILYHYAKNINADDIADDILKIVPAELRDDNTQVDAQTMAMVASKDQEIAQLKELVNQLNDRISLNVDTKVLDIQSKERIANENNKNKLIDTVIREDAESNRTLLNNQLQELNNRYNNSQTTALKE